MTDALTGTVTFQRKVNPAQYQSTEAGHFVQYEVDPDNVDEATIAAAKRAFALCKSVVLEELGIAYTIDPITGMVIEGGIAGLVAAGLAPPTQTGTTTATQALPTQTAVANGDFAGPTPPAATGNRETDRAAIKAWGTARYASHPNEFYDNRDKKASGQYKPTAPDLKHKDSQTGVWL